MAALILTAPQVALLTTIQSNLTDALTDGINGPGSPPPVIDPLDGFAKVKSADKVAGVKAIATGFAAYMVAAGVGGGLTTVINYAKAAGGGDGTLTFTNGVLTAAT